MRMTRISPRGEVHQGGHAQLIYTPDPRGREGTLDVDSRYLELLEESKIVFVEEPDVIDPVLQHR